MTIPETVLKWQQKRDGETSSGTVTVTGLAKRGNISCKGYGIRYLVVTGIVTVAVTVTDMVPATVTITVTATVTVKQQ